MIETSETEKQLETSLFWCFDKLFKKKFFLMKASQKTHFLIGWFCGRPTFSPDRNWGRPIFSLDGIYGRPIF